MRDWTFRTRDAKSSEVLLVPLSDPVPVPEEPLDPPEALDILEELDECFLL